MASSVAPGSTAPTHLAVARKLRSGWDSATASLTGPSPNTCSTSAPLNLILACISTAAALISPIRSRSSGGYSWPGSRRASTSRQASVSRTSMPRTGRPSNRNLCSSLIDLLQARTVAAGVVHVMGGAGAQPVDLVRLEGPHRLGGAADDQRTIGELLALGDQRAGANDAVAADAGAVQDHRADADQRAVADGAAVQHDLVAHRHVLAQHQRKAVVGMQDRAILDVAAAADVQGRAVAAQHRVEPDAGVGLQGHAADHRSTRRHPGRAVHLGAPVVQLIDGHAPCSLSQKCPRF
mmetsp:Transcript_41616/g.97794  ORF Transcript_41616/g.97794 Transcript_41616/m.97794 type:complete len:294 (-) Transcript_41616:1168-2049(-)